MSAIRVAIFVVLSAALDASTINLLSARFSVPVKVVPVPLDVPAMVGIALTLLVPRVFRRRPACSACSVDRPCAGHRHTVAVEHAAGGNRGDCRLRVSDPMVLLPLKINVPVLMVGRAGIGILAPDKVRVPTPFLIRPPPAFAAVPPPYRMAFSRAAAA